MVRLIKTDVIETPAVRVCDVDPQGDSYDELHVNLTSTFSRFLSPWLLASCRPHQPLVRQGSREGETREHRNDHPETAALFRCGNGAAKRHATI